MPVIAAGFDIVAPIPSCVLMFKQELRLMFPEDPDVQAVAERIFDPFEYLMLRHKRRHAENRLQDLAGQGQLPRAVSPAGAEHRTEDPRCAELVPDTTVDVIERCSGHNGTYGVKKEFRAASVKIGKPVTTAGAECGCRPLQPAIAPWRATRSKRLRAGRGRSTR